jgi:predicted acyltransferase
VKKHLWVILDRYDNRRLLSIDVFRGLTITAMILVNNPGSWTYVYSPLRHAQWHGWTPTDLIFPFFIILVGWSIYASKAAKALKTEYQSRDIATGGLRAIKLFALGIFLALFFYNFNDPDFNWLQDKLLNIRIMGVLQRIAVVYFITLLIVTFCRPVIQYFVAISILLIYVIAVFFIPYTDVNGIAYQGNLSQGFTFIDYVDTLLLSPDHLYLSALQPFASDPEGLFSTLPAIVSCLTGVWLAAWMHKRQVNAYFCLKLIVVGGLLTLAGGHLHSLIPINKPMWTPSYVLLTSGLALVSVSLLTPTRDKKLN